MVGLNILVDFFGFTSQQSITSVSISFLPENAQFGALDNFVFGAALPPAVPEPSSFVLLGSGLTFGAAMVRRRTS